MGGGAARRYTVLTVIIMYVRGLPVRFIDCKHVLSIVLKVILPPSTLTHPSFNLTCAWAYALQVARPHMGFVLPEFTYFSGWPRAQYIVFFSCCLSPCGVQHLIYISGISETDSCVSSSEEVVD